MTPQNLIRVDLINPQPATAVAVDASGVRHPHVTYELPATVARYIGIGCAVRHYTVRADAPVPAVLCEPFGDDLIAVAWA